MRRCIGVDGSRAVALPCGVHRHEGDAFAIDNYVRYGERATSADQERSRRSFFEGCQRTRLKACHLGDGDNRGAKLPRPTGCSPADRRMRHGLAFPHTRGNRCFLQEHNINLADGELIPEMPPVDVPAPNPQHAWLPLESGGTVELREHASARNQYRQIAIVVKKWSLTKGGGPGQRWRNSHFWVDFVTLLWWPPRDSNPEPMD